MAPDEELTPPLQFQTVHGRIGRRSDLQVSAGVVVIVMLRVFDDVRTSETAAALMLCFVALVLLGAARGIRARAIEGLHLAVDGSLSARGEWVTWTTQRAPAIDVLALSPSRDGRLELRLEPGGSSTRYIGAFTRSAPSKFRPWTSRRSNEVLVRHSGKRRARWRGTGIFWDGDDHAFLREFAAYVDALRGMETPTVLASAPAASTVPYGNPPLKDPSPRFRTEHSFVTRRGWRLGSVALWSFAAGGVFVAFAAVPGYRWIAAFSLIGFGVALRLMVLQDRAQDPASVRHR